MTFGVGLDPYEMAVGDFNGDGKLDVVTANNGTNDLSVLLGNGNGTFAPEVRLPNVADPYGLVVGDFNGDGHLDIVAVNYQSSNLEVFLGRGDGTFKSPQTYPLISPNLPTITAELEGNGVPQVLVANPQAGTISIFNSQGDGTLSLLSTLDVGGSPSGMVVGDFNGDGRPDLAVTDAASGELLVFLGLGDGTFESPVRYQVGKLPRSPIAEDLENDGILDIILINTGSNDVSLLFGRGDGTFEPAQVFPTGLEPTSLLAGANNGDGTVDIVAVNRSSEDYTEAIFKPGGNFSITTVKLAGITPSTLVTGDFTGDGKADLVIDDSTTGRVYVDLYPATNPNPILLPVNVGDGKIYLASADLFRNGEDDLILANAQTRIVTILSGWANNTFQNKYTIQVNVPIAGLTVVDLNKDGFPDILITEAGTGQIQTYLSGGNGVFSAAEATLPLPHPSPIVFHVSSGVSDIIDTDNNGQVLNRTGIAGASAQFNAPVNATLGTGFTVGDIADVQTGGISEVALLDTQEPLLLIHKTFVNGSTMYFTIALPSEGNYTRLISGDLFGNGRGDLVVINRTLNEIIIFQQTSSGGFQQYGNPIPAGFGPTDVTLANLNPGGLPDLVVADGSSGEVTLIGRTAQGGFVVSAALPAGLAAAGTVLLPTGLERTSSDEPVGVTSGVFGPSGLTDVVVVNRGTDQISILEGLPDGGLAAPSLDLTYSTGLDPIQVVAARLSKNGLLDLVVLNEGSHNITIFLNNGHGGFTAMPAVDAGDDPTALAVSDVTGDGVPDLVVSNADGDVLILAGDADGDGTFQPYQRADDTVSLAVGDLSGNGQNDFVLTNTSQDLLSVQSSTSNAGFLQGRGNGLLAPGPVAIADLNGDGIADLIVTNTGGNDVLVYLGLGHGQFAPPQEFFTGTAPVGVTVADLTGDGVPDLDRGQLRARTTSPSSSGRSHPRRRTWTLEPGPRLKAGDRPVSTTVADVYGNGEHGHRRLSTRIATPSLVLNGLGGGFFDDNQRAHLGDGTRTRSRAFVGHFTSFDQRPGDSSS